MIVSGALGRVCQTTHEQRQLGRNPIGLRMPGKGQRFDSARLAPMPTLKVRFVACHSEAQMREGWENNPLFISSPWRYRFCSTDTCDTCGAGAGEVCRSAIEIDPGKTGDALPYFHLQRKLP